MIIIVAFSAFQLGFDLRLRNSCRSDFPSKCLESEQMVSSELQPCLETKEQQKRVRLASPSQNLFSVAMVIFPTVSASLTWPIIKQLHILMRFSAMLISIQFGCWLTWELSFIGRKSWEKKEKRRLNQNLFTWHSFPFWSPSIIFRNAEQQWKWFNTEKMLQWIHL